MKTDNKEADREKAAKVQSKGKGGTAFSLSRIEAEGEKGLKEIFSLLEEHIPTEKRQAFDSAAKQAQKLLSRWSRSIEEHVKELTEKLDLPTKKDLEGHEEGLESVSFHLRNSVEEQVRRALNRLDIATKKDVDNLAEELERLKKDLARTLLRSSSSPKKRTVTRKPAQA